MKGEIRKLPDDKSFLYGMQWQFSDFPFLIYINKE